MRNKKAFSLLELSIVIIVIVVLIAGTLIGRKVLLSGQLLSARTQTNSSPVNSIGDIALWYETSLESSFAATEQVDGSVVTDWFDSNSQSSIRNKASQTTTASKPHFIERGMPNGIPSVRFDGNDLMTFDGAFAAYRSYTVFVVEKKNSSSQMYLLGGTASTDDDTNLHFGYSGSSVFRLGQHNDNLEYTSSSFLGENETVRMHTGIFDMNSGHKYWLNGGTNPEQSNTSTNPLTSWTGSAIGRAFFDPTYYYYTGDIGEIICFSRALRDEERQSVEAYLAKKYSIAITN